MDMHTEEGDGADGTARVWSIHDEEAARRVLSFDVSDVFLALGAAFTARRWCVLSLDAFGDDSVEAFCNSVEAAGPSGVWLTAADLLALAAGITQTIDGVLLGFPEAVRPEDVTPADLSLARFPASRADLAVLAIDSSYFEVYAKDDSVQGALGTRFHDVRPHDPAAYFQSS